MIKAEIEAATAETEVVRRQGEAKSASARLNALIGRGSQEPLAIPSGFRPLKTKLMLVSVQELARAANSALATTSAQVRAATGTKELTDLNYYPNVTVGATFVQRPTGDNTGQFMLNFKVPLQYEAKDAEQRAASSRLGAAQMRYDAIRIRLDGDVAEAWFGLEAVRKAIRIVEQRQLNPARLSVETARSGFAAGAADLATSLEAERRVQAIELEILKLRVEEQARYAELERLAGGSL
ncbi:MAG: outer membrane efflux protein [Gammaproteobacteria bacterium]|nr:MAG: outer membrane efflux [Methylocystaceae bacterium]TND00682.1 MAG: outer membrane efflux protein [Gammaproteobacteria bacterium]